MSSHSRVDELAKLLKVPAEQGGSYDWSAVEATVGGLVLPEDYKDLVETFPPGRFQGIVRLVRPGSCGHPTGEYLGRYGAVLERLRERQRAEPAAYPYAFHPEPGGLLPWGERPGGDLLYWVTAEPNPDAWPCVVHDARSGRWEKVPVRAVDLLTQLARSSGKPFVEDARSQDTAGVPMPDDFWDKSRICHDRPVDFSAELASLLPGAPESRRLPWLRFARETGTVFPRDYRDFIERFGAGVFCGITISSPELSGELGFDELLRRVRHGTNRRGPFATPIHPEWHGFVPWGRTEDGWYCGWAPTSDDPDEWGTVVALNGLESYGYKPRESFSSFLVKHADPERPVSDFPGRDPWEKPVSFVPTDSGAGAWRPDRVPRG